MKKIGIMFLCTFVFLLGACGVSYERDNRKGKIEEITFEHVKEKMDSDEKFMLLFTQTSCSGCISHKKMLKSYLKNHNLTVYEFNFTNYQGTNEDLRKLFMEEVPNMIKKLTNDEDKWFVGTPFTVVMDQKQLKEGISGVIGEEDFEELVVEYQLDEKK